MRAAGLVALVMLAACSGPTQRPVAPVTGSAPPDVAMVAFAPAGVELPRRPNTQMARDYVDLVFQMESGREVPVLSRYEGPVRVGFAGRVPPTARRDLALLLARLRQEAGLDIAEGPDPQIIVEFVPRRAMRALVPQAACFVAPRVQGFSQYKSARRSGRTDWTTLTRREEAAIFIPAEAPPQEVRDCLHEELAQALGPLNDLYRLPDSVFNDDNFHSILTGFDMLMLRVHYAGELTSGMDRDTVAARVPAIIDRLNPGGRGGAGWPAAETPRTYVQAIERALGGGAGLQARIVAAEEAVAISESLGWRDARTGFAWFALGRLLLSRAPDRAFVAFRKAGEIYHAGPLTRLQAAQVDIQLAAFALGAGEPAQAMVLTDAILPVAAQAQNAALLATALAIRAEALAALGRPDEARSVRLDSLSWGRYGFGEGAQARAAEIAALAAR